MPYSNLYDAAVGHNALSVFRLDSTTPTIDSFKEPITSITRTDYGDATTFSSQSPSKGNGSIIFPSSSIGGGFILTQNSTSTTNINTLRQVEAVFKTSYTGASTQIIWQRNRFAILRINGTTKKLEAQFQNNSGTGITIVSENAINNGIWHHIVVQGGSDNQSAKMWIDGVLQSTTSGVMNTTSRPLQSADNEMATRDIQVDFVATYLDYATLNAEILDATKIAEHFSIFGDVYAAPSPLTASSLFVNPTLDVQKYVTTSAAVSTASALMPDHAVSNFDIQTSLENYMANTAAPEQWYKFDAYPFVNSGSGGAVSFQDLGTLKRLVGEGPDKGSSLELAANYSNGYLSSSSSALFSTEISDSNFTVGTWFKFDSNLTNNLKNVLELAVSASTKVYIRTQDKKIKFGLVTSTNTYTHDTTAATYNDNAWHFAAIRWDGTNLYFYLDGTQAYTTTTSGTLSGINVLVLGGAGNSADTYKFQIAHPFIGTYSGIDHTKLSGIWNAGTRVLQGGAGFVEPRISNNNAYNDYVETLTPVLDLRFDGTGAPVNYSTSTAVSYTVEVSGTNYSTGVSTKNTRGYNITNKNTGITGNYNHSTSGFSDNTKSVSMYAKMVSVTGTDIHSYYTDQQFSTSGGMAIIATSGGPSFSMLPTLNNANWKAIYAGTGYYDGKYHLFTAVRNGTNLKFYVDGKSVGTTTITGYSQTDTGGYAIGLETVYFGAAAASSDKNIDELQVYDYALTDAQVFEMWQKIGVDTMNATTATFPTPVGVAGSGVTIHPGVMYAYDEFPYPGQEDTVAPTILPMTAFIDTVTPNFAATSTATIAASPMTASAQAENPGWDIGEINAVLHMDASAIFVNPQVLIPGFWNANPMIANPVEFVMPGFTSTQGGLVLAQAMTATAASIVPPAYKSLFDDKWYDLLYSQHSQRHGVTVANGGNGEAILKLFDDVTSSISLTTPIALRNLKNNLSEEITLDIPEAGSESVPQLYVSGDFNPSSNLPLIGTGYFDDYQRKAVRINNITTGNDNSQYSQFAFTYELSIKTTKSDQIISYGRMSSYTTYSQWATTFGLSDGKLFLSNTSAIGPAPLLHYKQNESGSIIGNKRIDDGQWHHIVVQYGFDDNRIQFWIDGDLDIQRIRGIRLYGLNWLGFNSSVSTYASDFQTSAWSYDTHRFISELEIDNHRYAYIKYEPVRAEPMTASATSGDHLAAGNRARALMLYWWPTDTFQGNYVRDIPFNKANWPDIDTWTKELTTADFIKSGPQEYYGWDIFPVDITGYFVSDLVKPEAYGGKENIVVGSKPFIGTGQNYNTNPEFLYNSQGAFKDPVTDDNRYIDLINDIDLRNFDAIFFKNFPDEAAEKDAFTTNEIVDRYFNLRESVLYDAFLKSLRAAVDTGLSLYITNPQLALDLGIVDRVETVPDMDDLSGFDSDPYSPTIVPSTASALPVQYSAGWYDSYKNNRLRVVNTLEGFTTEPSFIYTDYTYYKNDDQITFGGANRPFFKYTYRPNGLQVGDEFIISNDQQGAAREFYATPFANVKAGKVITAFANNIRRRLDLIENPYKNYATCIVVEPGDVLKGTQCGGKIVVNYTENLNGAVDWGNVDLISDYWINVAYNDGYIDAATRDIYLNADYNIDRQLEDNELTQTEYNKLAYWSSNGMYILSSATIIDDPTASRPKDGLGSGTRSEIVTKTRKSGTAYSAKVSTQSQWFTFAFSWQYPRMGIKVPNLLTRGFWWLSNRESYDGIVERPLAATASATLPMPVVTGQKDRTVNAAAMLSSATINQAVGTSAADISYAPLPMQAVGTMGNIETRYIATAMTASAILRTNNRIFTTAVDEVVVYVMHTDPILYIREDVIK